MKIAGIIAEYNPFHNGHAYQLTETRRRGATHIVAVMSGCYTQRGEPALCDKWLRTRAALLGGCDLVVELPLPYAMASAQRFARGGVLLLEALGVSMLSFGSECGEMKILLKTVEALKSPEVQARIPELLAGGITYAVARQRAVDELFSAEVGMIIKSPNNILAVEYLLALSEAGSAIEPVTIKRKGAGHDSGIAGALPSASALRKAIASEHMMPGEGISWECHDLLATAMRGGHIFDPALLDRLVLARLRGMSAADWRAVPDIAEGLENRLYKAVRKADSLDGLLGMVKTKRYTMARLRRVAMSGWLGITEDMGRAPPPYLRILGMSINGSDLLKEISPTLPMSASAAGLEKDGGLAARFIQLEAAADDLYGLLTPSVQPCGRDYTEPIKLL